MKTLFTFLVFIFLLTTAQAQDIVETLSGNTSGQAIIFKSSTGTTLFKVRGDGNVGIGTTNPTRKLVVSTPINNYGVAHTNGTIELSTFLNSTENSGMIGTFSNHPFQIFTSNAGPVMTFTTGGSSSGKVGIGTNSPGDKLYVAGNVRANIFYDRDNTNYFINPASTGTALTVAGKVGIGTTSPATELHIDGGSLEKVRFNNSSNSNGFWNTYQIGGSIKGFIGIGTGSTIFVGEIANALDFRGNTAIHLGNSATIAMTIFNNEVGIGTTTPNATLDVIGTLEVGSGSATGDGGGILDIIGTGGIQGNLVISESTADGTLIRFRRGGLTKGTITVSGNTVSYNAFTGSHYAWTSEKIEHGMLVSLTGRNKYLEDNSNSELMYGITKSFHANDSKLIGSYLGPQYPGEPPSSHNPHLTMAVGNGEMWVVEAGGDIAIGDYLISSNVPGHAMKDNGDFEISYIVARVAEPVDWGSVIETTHGRKHKKISVFFESFVRNHALDNAMVELNQTKAELDEIKNKLAEFDVLKSKITRIETALQKIVASSSFGVSYGSSDEELK